MEVKHYREKFAKGDWVRPCCGQCRRPLIKWGRYYRADVRLECGRRLHPLPVQRWQCPEHGGCSLLPHFLSRYLRYLVRVVAAVLEELVERAGRLETLLEVIGPSADTARRWVCQLLGLANERWLLQRCPQATYHCECLRPRVLSLAKASCLQLQISPSCFPVLLQRANLSHQSRYAN